jgi:hypothetical protein
VWRLRLVSARLVATRERATVSGVIPLDLPEFFILRCALACTFASAKPDAEAMASFMRTFSPTRTAR